jgi:hypothetical protein
LKINVVVFININHKRTKMDFKDLGLTMEGWGWSEKWSRKRKYWFNSITKQSIWDSDMSDFIQTKRPSVCSPTPRK